MANDEKSQPQSLLDLFTETCRDASSFLDALDGTAKRDEQPRLAYATRKAGEPARVTVVDVEGEELGPAPNLPPAGARQWLAERIRAALLATYERTPPVTTERGLEVLRLLIGEAALSSAETAAIWQQCANAQNPNLAK